MAHRHGWMGLVALLLLAGGTADAALVQFLEAENGRAAGVETDDLHGGFSDKSYANFNSPASGDFVEWEFAAPVSGNYTIGFRYSALGNINRDMRLIVNGSIVDYSLEFPATGGWGRWFYVFSTQTLSAGLNTVRLVATEDEASHIDGAAIRRGLKIREVCSAPIRNSRCRSDEAPDTLADVRDYNPRGEAARLLTQASFGATPQEVERIMRMGRKAWVDEQLSMPFSSHLADVERRFSEFDMYPIIDEYGNFDYKNQWWTRRLQRLDTWWDHGLFAPDQLRQRVAYALSQILVVSDNSDELQQRVRGLANYYDLLGEHAFGNYRDLLYDVSRSPIMGNFLSHRANEKPDLSENIQPDENYAREVMQLFSIGLWKLNPNGTQVTDGGGNEIPTYDNEIIKAFARVFTGWDYSDIGDFGYWRLPSIFSEVEPMRPFESHHDRDEKILLSGARAKANSNAHPELSRAITNIFNDRNVGPFISRQLIQRLVTSNPSPNYVARVARTFNNNGRGERGDMKAVVRAVLLDKEALTGHHTQPETFGKLREPVLKLSALWRAFSGVGAYHRNSDNGQVSRDRVIRYFDDNEMGQRALGAKSVFNFYSPRYSPPGPVQTAGLVAPEFQIINDTTAIRTTNRLLWSAVYRDRTEKDINNPIGDNWSHGRVYLNLEAEKAMAHQPDRLLHHLDEVLLNGFMSPYMLQVLKDHAAAQPVTVGSSWEDGQRNRLVEELIFAIVASPEFALQR